MPRSPRPLAVLAVAFAALPCPAADKPASPPPSGCGAAVDAYFCDEVWAKVAARSCLVCHKKGGDAEESRFILQDPKRVEGAARDEAMRHNRAAFAKMATTREKDQSRLLLKATGKLDHGGAEVLPAGSPGFEVLAGFVRRVTGGTQTPPAAVEDPNAPPFFAGVAMLDDRRLLRRATLSLAGRLPTAAEESAVPRGGRAALPAVLDALMKEDGFYLRLREGFNDIFLTLGVDGNPDQNVLSYEHFTATRQWYGKHDLSHVGDQKAQTQARYKLTADYRRALLEEPTRLVEYIVKADRPFTELVTADYTVVSPYTARGYGVYDQVKDKFRNPDDPFEFVPFRLPALKSRVPKENQESPTGFYPHAGVLTCFTYLARYPTTETNRNRLRARMFYQHFLGVDVLELAARVSDAAAASSKYKVPTMEAAECVVCHRTLDPVAGQFQDYWRFAEQGVFGRRKGGWFADMFPAGYEGEDLPGGERWRSLQWLGERTAKDPRFAVAMTEHAYYLLFGRRPLLEPKDAADPLYPARLRAYRAQRKEVERIAGRFAAGGFNFKAVLKDWVQSDFYRADGLEAAAADPRRQAELDDLGLVRLLSPEQVERKVAAVFGTRWGRLDDKTTGMLYGGIDSQEVTERAADPSGAMGALMRILSNDVACKTVAKDFSLAAADRKLFPGVEPDVVPGSSADADAAIRKAAAHLHERILGRADPADVDRTVRLFAGVVADARQQKGLEKKEIYTCRQGGLHDDPHYTVRGWRAVVTYLLRRPEFLYE